MIYITGDCHADFSRFLIDKFPIQKEMTKDDYRQVNLQFTLLYEDIIPLEFKSIF